MARTVSWETGLLLGRHDWAWWAAEGTPGQESGLSPRGGGAAHSGWGWWVMSSAQLGRWQVEWAPIKAKHRPFTPRVPRAAQDMLCDSIPTAAATNHGPRSKVTKTFLGALQPHSRPVYNRLLPSPSHSAAPPRAPDFWGPHSSSLLQCCLQHPQIPPVPAPCSQEHCPSLNVVDGRWKIVSSQ